MTDNKKGLVASNDQTLNPHAKHSPKFIRIAIGLIANPQTAIIAAVAGFTFGLMLVKLWGGA